MATPASPSGSPARGLLSDVIARAKRLHSKLKTFYERRQPSPSAAQPDPPLPWREIARPVAICAGTGAWGVVVGYALFFLWRSEVTEGQHWIFWVGLAIAGFSAWVVDSLREQIKEGHITGSFGVMLLTATVIELFVIAAHEMPTKSMEFWGIGIGEASHEQSDPAEPASQSQNRHEPIAGDARQAQPTPGKEHSTTRSVFNRDASSTARLAGFAVLWIVIGAVLAGSLAVAVIRIAQNAARGVYFGGHWGMMAAVTVAPIGIVVYCLVVRFVGETRLIVTNYDAWKDYLEDISRHYYDREFMVFLRFYGALVHGEWWALACLIVPAGVAAYGAGKLRSRVPLYLFGGAVIVTCAFILLTPFFYDEALGRVFVAAALAAVVWGIPWLVLGGMTPLLRKTSADTRLWFRLAFTSAVVLFAITGIRLSTPGFLLPVSFSSWWLVVPACILLYACWNMQKRLKVTDHWPFLALLSGTIACGATGLLQQATNSAILSQVQLTNQSLWLLHGMYRHPEQEQRFSWLDANPFTSWQQKAAQAGDLLAEVKREIDRQRTTMEANATRGDPLSESLDSVGLMEWQTLRNRLVEAREVYDQLAQWERTGATRQFELALNASVAFWVTIGILATWKWVERRDALATKAPNSAEHATTSA